MHTSEVLDFHTEYIVMVDMMKSSPPLCIVLKTFCK
jgi:hypothetical protein